MASLVNSTNNLKKKISNNSPIFPKKKEEKGMILTHFIRPKLSILMLKSDNVMLVTQSCLAPCKPMDCSLPGSSVLGIFQARILR